MRPAAAGLALGLPLLLLAAACGSQAAPKFRPAGAAVSFSPAVSAPRAPVPFPGQVTFDFGPLPGDPQQAAVAGTDHAFLLAYYDAIYTGGRNKSYASYIGDKGVLRTVQASVAAHVAEHQGLAGVDRHFGTTVTPDRYYPGELDVTYCADEAGLRYTDARTGRVLGNASAPGQLYYLESDTFARTSHGWRLVGILTTPYPTGQARRCKP